MSKNQSIDHESALVMNAYVDGISGHKSLFEQVGVRKVDFVDGVTPDLDEKMFSGKGEFEVKYASSKKGPIKVSKFNTLKDAQKFLAQVKGEGMNGIISKGGKPVKEESEIDEKKSDYEDQIKAFLSKGGKVKKHSLDQRKIDKVTKAFKKKYGTMKSKEDELDAKDREELEKMMGEENKQVDEIVKKRWKKGKYTVRDANTDKVIGTYDSGEKASKAMDKLMDTGKYSDLEVKMEEVEIDEKMDGRKKFSGKQAKKDNEDRRAAQRKKLGILGPNEEVEIEESDKAMMMKLTTKAMKAMPGSPKQKELIKQVNVYREKLGMKPMKEETVNEKKGSDYDLYHKTFSGAMQHAYAQAKKRGYVVDKDDIDSKVATGPRKPSMGKTNRYILGTDKKQKLHVQVANLDNKRYELNMYIEETELEEGKMGDSDQQHRALVATKARLEMKKALKSGKSQSQAWWNKQAKLAGLAKEHLENEEADPQSDIKKKVEKTAMKVAKDAVKSEAHDPKDYAKKVAAVNKMFKVKSPKELSPDKKKKYFDTLDKMHKAKGEKPEIGEDNVARLQKQIQRNNDRESKLKDKLTKEKQVTKTAKKMSTVGQTMRADIAPKSTGNTSASGTTTQSTTAKAAPKPKTQKPQSATMKNSFTPVGTFLEDTRVFMNGLWEKAANEADGMDMSGPPPVMGKKTMTKKSQDKVEINPKEEE